MRQTFDVLVNDASLSNAYPDAASEIVGIENAAEIVKLVTDSEDFADMLRLYPAHIARVAQGFSPGT